MIGQIFAIACKDIKIFANDVGAIVLIFIMPLTFVALMSYALSQTFSSVVPKPQQLLMVTDEDSPLLSIVREQLGKVPSIQLVPEPARSPASRSVAEKRLLRGEVFGVLVFPQGFAQLAQKKSDSPLLVELVLDPSAAPNLVQPVLGVIRGTIARSLQLAQVPRQIDQLLDRLTSGLPDVMAAKIKSQVDQELPSLLVDGTEGRLRVTPVVPQGQQIDQFPDSFQQNVPAYTIFGIFWIVMLLVESVLKERRQGTFRRLLVAPLRPWVLLLGKLVPYFVINLLQAALLFAFARLAFGMSLGNSLFALFLVSLGVSSAATGLGVLLASVVRTEAQTRGLTILLLLILSALGGCFVPRFIMPQSMQLVGLVTPHAWALEAYLDLLVRGFSWTQVLPKVGVLFSFAFGFFVLGAWRFRFQSN